MRKRKKQIISHREGIMIYIDEYGNKRWKFTSKKGAIYGKDAKGKTQRWRW